MRFRRQTTSFRLTSRVLCFCLLLQGSGIAQASRLPPKQTFLSMSEFEIARLGTVPNSGESTEPAWPRFVEGVRGSVEEAGDKLAHWLRAENAEDEAPLHVARAGGVLPLPPRLMVALLASSSRGQAGPPSPPGQGTGEVEKTPPAEIARLAEKLATEEVPLLAGWNLISLPEEPADPDPAVVFANLAGQLAKVEAFDACDLADPWKIYDPADPASSDLTVADHRIGIWIKATTAAVLPSEGTLPATTTIELCEGWNLIGFPAGQPRHPHAALSSIAGKWQRVFAYDAFDPEDPWEVFDVAVPDWANDLRLMRPGRGYWVLASEAATLEIRNEGPPPTVAIASPADLAVVTQPTDVLGTVDSDRLESWTLTSRPIGDGDAVTLATGNAPVTGTVLANFDPTLLLNGLYELDLTATDVQGQQVSESIAVSVEGQMKIGHFTLSFVDLAVRLSGLDIEVIRTYDSRDRQQRDFGVGWTLDVRQGSYRNNRPPGDGWQLQTGFLPCDTVLESKSHLTVVRLSDQEVYRFALQLANGVPSTSGGCFATARFDFIDGPLPGTTLEIIGNDQVFYENGSDQVINVDAFEPYEPENVRLTTRDGRVFELSLNDGVTLLEDPNGNQLSITSAGITHSSGRSVAFDRDAEGRITGITDPMDRIMTYAYDAAGDLISFTDREGAVARFTYDGHHRLLDIIDPLGVRAVRSEYNDEGRLIKIIDANGRALRLDHDLGNRREIVTNRLGFATVLEYDSRGNVLRETDELGNVTVRTYDGKDRLLTEIDPLGNPTTNVYNSSGDLVSMTDPLGNTTSFTYDSRSNPTTITDPRNKITTNAYDSRGNLLSITDPLGSTDTFTYGSRGEILRMTDGLGNATSFGYDAAGNQILAIDAMGTETTWTYDGIGYVISQTTSRTLADGTTETLTTTRELDALGRPTRTILPDGSMTRATYDLLGAMLSRIDELGRETTFVYDNASRQTETHFPDGLVETRSYDAEGRIAAVTDRAGRVTTFNYDPIGHLLRTVHPDGTTIASTYDAAGQLVASTDERGYTTSQVFDAAGRITQVIDALGHTTASLSYDAAGNQTSITDQLSQATTFSYDDAGRLIATTLPDGTTMSREYDDIGRQTAAVDQAGVRSELGYDALSRLIRVSDAVGGITRYVYDEQGNRTSQTDANGHTTRYTYDRLGRRTGRILPGGATESFTYDVAGNRISRTDFSGVTTTYAYDVNDYLTSRSYPGGISVSFTYTLAGQRATATDSRGVTSYAYDDRDRLVLMSAPEGWALSYTWDAAGNRTQLTADLGAQGNHSTDYTYDALGRMTTVTDARGGTYAFSYNAAGRRASVSYPNGVVTSYTGDAIGRLLNLHTEASDGTILQDYTYSLGPTGNRESVAEQDGTVRAWEYDELYRMIGERVTDADGALRYENVFSYDTVGNRLTQNRTDFEGSVSSIAYAYDARDRLVSETVIGGAVTTYGWDANGNLISRSGSEGTSTYRWDAENRLISVELPNGAVVGSTYDADGVRIAAAVTPGSNGVTTKTEYVTDTSGPLSQVVAEITDTEVLAANYARGDQLLGILRDGGERYVHGDHIGSVRALTEPTAALVDTYAYEAFGELFEHFGSDLSPFLFAGEQRDPATEQTYLRARWMQSEVGRLLSMDPFLGSALEPVTQHPYLYARNNPANWIDPSGRINLPETLVTLSARALTIVKGMGPRVVARFARGNIGNFWRALGRYSEAVGLRVLRELATKIPGLKYVGQAALGASILDVVLTLANCVVWVEMKYRLPDRSGPQSSRLVRQAREGVEAAGRAAARGRTSQFVLWSLKAPTAQELCFTTRALGRAARSTRIVNGVGGLFFYLWDFFGPC